MSSKSMSSGSEKTQGAVNTLGIRGIPSKCICGCDVTIYTSKTQENPGRPFFRCPTKRDDHMFKWVEEAVFEEVEDKLPKFGIIETEMSNVKSEVEELKALIQELKEDGIRSKNEIRECKMMNKICFVCICFVVIVIVCILVAKAKEKKLVLSY